jgi:hypothetical protein
MSVQTIQMLVHGERRKSFYQVVLGVWLLVAIYAIAHDQYLVRIAPEHFMIYHSNPGHIKSAPLLAAYLAFKASISPGFALGVVSWFVARSGKKPKLGLRLIFVRIGILLLTTETISLISAAIVWLIRKPLYPEDWYPDFTLPMLITQTIQITCYLVALAGSPLMLLWLFFKRKRMVTRSRPETV